MSSEQSRENERPGIPCREHLRGQTLLGFFAIVLAVLGMLACLSYLTTARTWDGGFPDGEFCFNIRNADGQPIPKAVLRVYRAGTRDPAYGYPLDDYRAGHDLVTDDTGRITALRRWGGLQFGGDDWHLFWVIRIGDRVPEFDFEITAAGSRPFRFGNERLFDDRHRHSRDMPKAKAKLNNQEIELTVYEDTIILERE
jgi:hypothetical protein